MTDEYLEQRKRYIQEARNSFSQEDNGRLATNARLRAGVELERDTDADDIVGSSAFWKVKILLAVMLFAAFVFCDQTGTKLFSMTTDSIIQTLQTNQKLPRQIEETLKDVFARID